MLPPGVPTPVAMCITPVSPETTARASFRTAPVSCRPKTPRSARHVMRRGLRPVYPPPARHLWPTDDRDVEAFGYELVDQRTPVLRRPSLGGVCCTGSHPHHRPLRSNSDGCRPGRGMSRCARMEKELGGIAVGRQVEAFRRREIAFRYRPVSSIDVFLVNQNQPRQPVLGIASPLPGTRSTKSPAPQTAVEIEQVGVPVPFWLRRHNW